MTDYEKLVAEEWERTRDRFNRPFLNPPVITDSIEGQDTAHFDYLTRRHTLSSKFLDELAIEGVPPERSIRAILTHETGHYVHFPRELSSKLFLMAQAHQYFKENSGTIWGYYVDLVDEGECLAAGTGGDDLIELRTALARKTEPKSRFDNIMHKLLHAKYARSFDLEPPELDEEETGYLEEIANLNYIGLPLGHHRAGIYRFGKMVEKVLRKHPPPPQQGGSGGSGSPSGGGLGSPSLTGVSDKEIDGALTKILKELGPHALNQVKRYLAHARPGFEDPFDNNTGAPAGTSPGSFERHDELIGTYDRWASGFGLYIAKRPMESNSTSLYRSGRKEYEPGDSLSKIDIFGSKGIIGVPGVSVIHTETEELLPAKKWCVPHALIGLDTSASMEHPGNMNGSVSTLAAFILGRNYHANNALVGGWNFSTGIVFRPPSRDLQQYFSLMCSWWGGGTNINVEKLKEFMATTDLEEKVERWTDDEDYERALDLVPRDKRGEFVEKNLHVETPTFKKKLEKLDNILITDGFIGNKEETIAHLSSLGEITRNFVFITNEESYKDWSSLSLPNTTVYCAVKKEDLLNLALGQSRSLLGGRT